MNSSEILHQHAITSAIRHQTNLKHCAAANSRYFNHLNRARLSKDIIFKIAGNHFAIIDKINFNVSLFLKRILGALVCTHFFNFSSLRILHVIIQGLTVSDYCPWHVGDLGKICLCGDVLQSDRNKAQKELNSNLNW